MAMRERKCPLLRAVLFLSLLPALPADAQTPAVKAPPKGKVVMAHRWMYLSTNLLVPENAARAETLMRRAKAAGYNGVVLADYKMNILNRMGESYTRNAEKVRDTAKALGLDLIAAVCPVGYSNGLLAHDPNLVEGLPVKDAPFVVKGRTADLEPPASPLLPDPGFEAAEANRFTGWDWQDGPGTITFADTDVKHGGLQSLRMQGGSDAGSGGNARIVRKVTVEPFRQYHVSAWVRTQDFETPGNARANVLDPDGRALMFHTWPIRRTQDWTQYHAVFNSLDNTQVSLYLGVWGIGGGRIWWDDLVLEDAGLLNAIRRDGCPLAVAGADGTVYEEGKDFEAVRDGRMGVIPWAGEYEVWHAPPSIRLTENSRIKDGERLRVSYHHAITVHDGQAVCCLSHPEVYRILEDQVRRVNRLFQPRGFLMSHDEVRVANWCDLCRKRGLTPGRMLADNVKRCAAMIRAENPKAAIYAWSDMFDPNHNAHDDYYLVNGNLAGAWEGLDKGVTVLNWNFDGRAKTAQWFAGRGHDQVLAAYYDGSPDQVKDWLSGTAGIPRITGVMYTTWADRYDDLEAFAKAAGFGPDLTP